MMPMPTPPRPPTPPARMFMSESRAEIAAVLLGHLGDEETVTGLLDLAELDGGGQTARARVSYDQKTGTWLADLFGPARDGEAA